MYRYWLALPALLLTPSAGFAQEEAQEAAASVDLLEQRANDIVAVFRGEMAYDAVFGQIFRDQVTEEQFLGIATQLGGQFGTLVGVESVEPVSELAGTVSIRYERGIATGNMQLSEGADAKVLGFLLTGVEPINDSAESLAADIAALPGEASILVARLDGSEAVVAHNADMPLALGSTFKLYVLSALTQAIAAGEHSWDEIVPLTVSSFPSGMLQDWPDGSPITLHTLATLMISISDNTATDQLIAMLGREAIEAEVAASGHAEPSLMSPMMTTRDLFVLKSGPDAEVEAYRAANSAERLAMLEGLANVDRAEQEIMAAFADGPNAIDLEWFASAQDIAALFTRLRDADDEIVLGVMGVNPAVPDSELTNWDYIGFKGGSEPGVLNFSYVLQSPDGVWSTVTIGWNNPEASVDQGQLNLLAMRAIALAR